MKDVVLYAGEYFRNKSSKFYRIKRLPFFVENFPYIFNKIEKDVFLENNENKMF
jgi:hypothetical protein